MCSIIYTVTLITSILNSVPCSQDFYHKDLFWKDRVFHYIEIAVSLSEVWKSGAELLETLRNIPGILKYDKKNEDYITYMSNHIISSALSSGKWYMTSNVKTVFLYELQAFISSTFHCLQSPACADPRLTKFQRLLHLN